MTEEPPEATVEALQRELEAATEAMQREKNEKEAMKLEKEAMKRENDELTRKLKLFEKTKPEDEVDFPIGFVSSVSTASDNHTTRDKYYKDFLDNESVDGGFVAHDVFVRFVKGARGKHEWKEAALNDLKSEAEGWADLLRNRQNRSFLAADKPDLEAPQSLVASELLRMAVRIAESKIPFEDRYPVFVSHQGVLKRVVVKSDELLLVDSKAQASSVEYKVDVLATVISEKLVKVLATIEYKPDTRTKEEARVAQRDMYATNTISMHQRPCIGIDIAGGNNVHQWNITAMAYFADPTKHTLYQCSKMYSGSGINALLSIAAGLCYAAQDWKDDACEHRLGPVVARHGERVHKVYDNPTFRKPNVDVVRKMLGEAEEWASEDEKVTIVTTQFIRGRWTNTQVSSIVFAEIIESLIKLQNEFGCHGDIRLANLLYCDKSGYITDFDFVGRKHYPAGLRLLTVDGERHSEVEEAILNGEIEKLSMEEKHDWYSLGAVLRLFSCVDESFNKEWNKAIKECRNQEAKSAADSLREKEFYLKLSKDFRELFETGPTPKKE